MLIFSLKLLVDVDRKGKKVVINTLVDPPMYPIANIAAYFLFQFRIGSK